MKDEKSVYISQYLAALAMLKETVSGCPDGLWDHPDDRTKFWHVAYHALFYLHLYLQDTGGDFQPWARHRPEYHRFQPDAALKPYDRADILEYLEFCQAQVRERVQNTDFDAVSGFDWLPFDKRELQLYNLRHLQQHTGELMERLGTRTGVEIHWVGTQQP